MATRPGSAANAATSTARRLGTSIIALALLGAALTATPAVAATALSVSATSTASAAPNATTPLTGVAVSGGDDGERVQVTVGTSVGTLGVTPTSGTELAFGNAASGTDSITLTGTRTDLNASLASLQLTTGSQAGQTATISVTALPTGAISSASVAFAAPNQHFYEYVRSPQITWTDAKAQAEQRTLLGQKGYLATIPNKSINDLISTRLQGARDVWFGGQSTDTPNQNPARTWRWTGGPLAGQTFTTCSNWVFDDTAGCHFTQDPGTYTSWAPGEPNNCCTTSTGAGYTYDDNGDLVYDPGTPVAGSGETVPVTNWNGTVGEWNDLRPTYVDYIDGYIVEYGDKVKGATSFDGLVSATSDVAIVNPPAAPDAPTAVSAKAGDGSAVVTFTPGAGNGSTVTGFTVTASPGGRSVTCTASPCTVGGLTNGTAYTFTVVANSSAGPSAASTASAPVTPAPAPSAPGAPTVNTVVSGDRSVTVGFTPAPPSSNVPDPTGYEVSTDGGLTWSPATVNGNQITVTGLTNGTSYKVSVRAVNTVGKGAASSPVTATPATRPGGVTNVRATVDGSDVTVAFDAPASDGGSPVVTYTVVAPNGASCTTTTTSCTVKGLPTNKSYTFTVTADNTAVGRSGTGTGPSVVSGSVTLAGAPDAPTAVSAKAGDGSAVVTFTPGAGNGSTVTGFTVTASPGGRSVTCTASPCTVGGLTNGTAYTFTVVANSSAGPSAASTASAPVTPAPSCAPAATVDVAVTTDQKKPAATLVSGPLTTTGPGRLLVAAISADGPASNAQAIASVTGGGVTWTRVSQGASYGTTEIWQAWAPSTLSKVTVSAKLKSGEYNGSIAVTAWKGAATSVGARAQAVGADGKPKVSLSTTACNGVIVATGHDWTRAVSVTAPTGQTLRQFVDTGVHDTYWQQRVDAPVAKAGTAVTVSVADLTKADRWSYAAVEVLPAG